MSYPAGAICFSRYSTFGCAYSSRSTFSHQGSMDRAGYRFAPAPTSMPRAERGGTPSKQRVK